MSDAHIGLLVNAAATWFMCGVIWLVQLVHYPMFAHIQRDRFRDAMIAHQNRIRFLVAGPMLLEGCTSLLLLIAVPVGVSVWVCACGAALTAVWVVSTALVQVPQHERLAAEGWDDVRHRQLVRLNWLRTLAWTVRSVLCGAMLMQSFAAGPTHTSSSSTIIWSAFSMMNL